MRPHPHPANKVGHFLEGSGFSTVNHLRNGGSRNRRGNSWTLVRAKFSYPFLAS